MGAYRHFPIFMITLPLLGAVLLPILGYYRRRYVPYAASLPLLASGVLGILLMNRMPVEGYLSYQMGSWPPPIGIEISIDFLALFVMLVICGISLLALVFSWRYISKEVTGGRIIAYYSLFLLLSGSMLGFVATGDIFNLFVFMEILAISSYALVAITGNRNAVRAAFKYLLMGAPSSIMVLLAIGFLYSVTGSLNMADLATLISQSGFTQVLIVSYILLVIGFGVKAALFPLHLWLPDAHSIAPSPISAMLSGLVVEVGAFAILRITFSVFTVGAQNIIGGTVDAVSVAAAAAVLFGGIMAIYQKDLKMMIAYSTISHIGYIFLGITAFTKEGLTGAVYHMLDHGLAKACLFLCAGAFIYVKGYRRIDQLKGAWQQMPFTCAAFALAAWSVIGLPPSAGFISKWYLIVGNIEAGRELYVVILLVGAVLAAVYCFRVIYYMFFQPPEEGAWESGGPEAPVSMLVPVWVLSLGTLLFGVFSYLFIQSLLDAAAFLL
ncbi:MAG: monovalent cation/H+ antiporter subunit D family protein [Actinomycetota bacterium]|nr:monovalent cation/H+ antiporter subunit D family protein [Actinomycetota bacterium]